MTSGQFRCSSRYFFDLLKCIVLEFSYMITLLKPHCSLVHGQIYEVIFLFSVKLFSRRVITFRSTTDVDLNVKNNNTRLYCFHEAVITSVFLCAVCIINVSNDVRYQKSFTFIFRQCFL